MLNCVFSTFIFSIILLISILYIYPLYQSNKYKEFIENQKNEQINYVNNNKYIVKPITVINKKNEQIGQIKITEKPKERKPLIENTPPIQQPQPPQQPPQPPIQQPQPEQQPPQPPIQQSQPPIQQQPQPPVQQQPQPEQQPPQPPIQQQPQPPIQQQPQQPQQPQPPQQQPPQQPQPTKRQPPPPKPYVPYVPHVSFPPPPPLPNPPLVLTPPDEIFKTEPDLIIDNIITYPPPAVTISIIIPAVFEDFLYCTRFIRLTLNSACKDAHEILMIVSGVTDYELASKVSKYYQKDCYKLKIYYRDKPHSIAENRNFGVAHSTGDYVTFFDTDDIMSETRTIYFIKLIQKYPDADLLLHAYTVKYDYMLKHPANLDDIERGRYQISSLEIYEKYLQNKHRDAGNPTNRWCCKYVGKYLYMANGWCTVRRSIFNIFKFNESYTHGEDSDFTANVIFAGYKTHIIVYALGTYMSESANCSKTLLTELLNS